MNRNPLRFLLLPLLALTMIGCPKQAAKLAMTLQAAPNVNPDPGGKSLSVVVRVYQLKDKGRLESADYNAIWKLDKDTLSDDFLAVQERVVQPGTQEMLEIQTNPMAKYVGVVALFRNPSGDSWRRLVPIGGKSRPIGGKTQTISLTLRDQGIELVSAGK